MAVLTRAGDSFSAQMMTTIAPNGAMKCRPPEALDDNYLAQSHRQHRCTPAPLCRNNGAGVQGDGLLGRHNEGRSAAVTEQDSCHLSRTTVTARLGGLPCRRGLRQR